MEDFLKNHQMSIGDIYRYSREPVTLSVLYQYIMTPVILKQITYFLTLASIYTCLHFQSGFILIQEKIHWLLNISTYQYQLDFEQHHYRFGLVNNFHIHASSITSSNYTLLLGAITRELSLSRLEIHTKEVKRFSSDSYLHNNNINNNNTNIISLRSRQSRGFCCQHKTTRLFLFLFPPRQLCVHQPGVLLSHRGIKPISVN